MKTALHHWAKLRRRSHECSCYDCNRIQPTKPPKRPDTLPAEWTWLDVRAGRR